jgi:hypothetical protein
MMKLEQLETRWVPTAGRGGDGPGSNLAVISGSPGTAQLFTIQPSGQLTATGGPIAPFPGFTGVLRAGVGDVNGDGIADTVLVTGPGSPVRYAIINGSDGGLLVPPTAPFPGSEDFSGGAFVAVGDIEGDGRAEFAFTPDVTGGPRVTLYSFEAGIPFVRGSFLVINDASFRGGARATLGDVNGDGVEDLIVGAGIGGGPRVAVFDGNALLAGIHARITNDFFAFPGTDSATLRNGVFLAAGDFDGDGHADLAFGGGPGGAPRVFILSGNLLTQSQIDQAQANPIANYFAFDSSERGGVRLVAKEANSDSDRELVAASGETDPPEVIIYVGATLRGSSPLGLAQPFPGMNAANGIFVG